MKYQLYHSCRNFSGINRTQQAHAYLDIG